MNHLQYASALEKLMFYWRGSKAVYLLSLILRAFQCRLLFFLLRKVRCKSRSWSMKLGKVVCFLKVKPASQKLRERAVAWMMAVAVQLHAALATRVLPPAVLSHGGNFLPSVLSEPRFPSFCTGLHREGSCSVSIWKTRKQHSLMKEI